MKTLTVISPVYQEEEVIADFYKELKTELDKLQDYKSTILFVVDKGKDNTLNILKDICDSDKSTRVLWMSSRFGHQMSLLAGIDNSDSDVVVMIDSDLQHPTNMIPKFLHEFEQGADIVNAVREDTEDIGILKKISSKLFYWFFNSMSKVELAGNAPDFRLISGRVSKIIKEQIRERNLFLRGMISWVGFSQVSIPFTAAARSRGKGKYSMSRLVGLALSGIVSFSKKPLRLMFFSGVVLFVTSIVIAVILAVRFFIFEQEITSLLIILVTILFFSSIQFVFFGIIGEYLGAIFEEVKNRPNYIVDEKINF
jgi:polyisoprenyl-phosphate glycosyltransferase